MGGSVHQAAHGSPVRSSGGSSQAAGWRRMGLTAVAALVAACAGGVPRKADLETRSTAEQATRTGDWKAAADRWYAIFLAGGCAEVQPCVETARALIELGDPESASSIVKLGLDHHPDHADLLEMEAEALVACGFRRSAESSYARALAGHPDCRTCLLGLARQRMELGKESQAIRPLERLVALGCADYEVLSLLARARLAAGDVPGAFEAWCAAFDLEPAIGRELAEGEIADRLEAAMLFTDPSLQAVQPSAPEACGRWLKRVIERDPQNTRAHFELGVLYERCGKLDLAIGSYRRAVETDPACLVALTNLALLYSKRGEVSLTRAMVDRALALETDDGRRKALERLVEECEQAAQDGSEP